jgi:hypothetical protein
MQSTNTDEVAIAVRRAMRLRTVTNQVTRLVINQAVSTLAGRGHSDEEIAAATGMPAGQVRSIRDRGTPFPRVRGIGGRRLFNQLYHELWSRVPLARFHLNHAAWAQSYPHLGLRLDDLPADEAREA